MAGKRRPEPAFRGVPTEDTRSVLVLAEPWFGSEGVVWHAMGFVAGEPHSDIQGTNRGVVLDDVLCSVAAQGVEFTFGLGREEHGFAEPAPTTPDSGYTFHIACKCGWVAHSYRNPNGAWRALIEHMQAAT